MKQLHRGPQDWRHKPSTPLSSSSPSSTTSALSTSDKTSSPLANQQPVLSSISPGNEDENFFPPPKAATSELPAPQRRPKVRERSSTFSAQGNESSVPYAESSRLSRQDFKFNPFQPQQQSFCFLSPSELKTSDKRRGVREQRSRSKDIEFRRAASLSCVPQMSPLSQVQQPLRSAEEERRRGQRRGEGESEEWKKLIFMIPRNSLIGSVDYQIKLMDKFMIGKYDKSLEKLTKLPSDLKLKKSICRIVQVSGKDGGGGGGGTERNFIIEKLSIKSAGQPKFKKIVDLSKVEKAKRCWDEATQMFAIGLIPKSEDEVVFLRVVPQRKTADLLGILEKMISFLDVQESISSRTH